MIDMVELIMSKVKTSYQCVKCHFTTPKWAGQCPNCETWGTLSEETLSNSHTQKNIALKNLSEIQEEKLMFMPSIPEFDAVCGGGLPKKGVILIAGEPGTGKSTLLLQLCGALRDGTAVYITAEEAADQIKLRAQRLQIPLSNIACASANCTEKIIDALSAYNPSLVIIDSIQTIYSQEIDRTPGSINQMRACGHLLIDWCKNSNAALIIVAHVTKDGVIAGPKIIEHMVDVVMYFEGERGDQPLRILRTIKNRFGSTDVIGVFEITKCGLLPLKDISKAFITNRKEYVIGSATMASLDGNRVIMLEMQALISDAPMQSPRRMAVGWDVSRMHTVIAILESKCRIPLASKHVYCSVVGGIKVAESAGDLPAAISIISEACKIPLSPFLVAFGEISPSGEIREVKNMQTRVNESIKLGFETIIVPISYIYEKEDKRIIRFSKIYDLARWLKNQHKIYSEQASTL